MATENPSTGGVPPFLKILVVLAAVVWAGWKICCGGEKIAPVEMRRAEARVKVREAVTADATKQMHTAEWIDKAKGIVRLPIADAKRLAAVELAAKKPAPSQLKADPLPPLPPVDPNSKEPAPASLPNAPGGAATIQFASATAPAAPAPAAAPAAAPAPAPAKPAEPARPPIINTVPAPAPAAQPAPQPQPPK